MNIGPSVKATALSQMEAAIEALSRDLSKLRTGRASTGILLPLAILNVVTLDLKRKIQQLSSLI